MKPLPAPVKQACLAHRESARALRDRALSVMFQCGSDRVGALLTSSDPDDPAERNDPDLSVSDLAGPCGACDRFDDVGEHAVVDEDLHLHLRHEVDLVLRSSVGLGVPALTAETLHLAHRETGGTDDLERLLHDEPTNNLDPPSRSAIGT